MTVHSADSVVFPEIATELSTIENLPVTLDRATRLVNL